MRTEAATIGSEQSSLCPPFPSLANNAAVFEIGGVSLSVVDPREDSYPISASLGLFRSSSQNPDISIQVEWVRDLPLDSANPVFDSGCTWLLYEQGSGFRFDFRVPALGREPYKRLLIDRQFSQATLQIRASSDPGDCRLTPLMYPLDELLIMHRLTQQKAIELHGCGIVRQDGTANLFVGHSGAGKSTTTRLWTSTQNALVLSDDRIIVRRDESSEFGEETGRRMRMYGTPWHGEAMYASPQHSVLDRIFILEHGRGNVLTRLAESEAVAELFARSFVPFHRHEYVESALTFLQEVVAAVPVYRYSFEPDQRAVDAILNFHD
ncbi:MAG TPA: hypothetical protein VKV39_03165 [Candidatus Sulfotelmatobacter sp.]|nr:hypothetical protein [Candidatus Sulfotelmatobacter sp.]